ncbi:hypothetical protein PR202_ga14713 [Eleusine coracana subsp. coracana]|uniref:Uncharacterized protein n=1 Tax=Eleusine coracana subsp. coracana TaxID=191504 RepID=A0AAV5CID5_ELECO|nr:hypothetical protein PR202_ga14713 [Eleusine coracana subsp. coracana]
MDLDLAEVLEAAAREVQELDPHPLGCLRIRGAAQLAHELEQQGAARPLQAAPLVLLPSPPAVVPAGRCAATGECY